MNVTEVRHPDFKNIFPGIFNFTVGILDRLLLFSESLPQIAPKISRKIVEGSESELQILMVTSMLVADVVTNITMSPISQLPILIGLGVD